jgi:Family of unknown function (DUF5302)
MADRAAGQEGSGDMVSPGMELGVPGQATADGRANSRDTGGEQDESGAADEVQTKFREALERKHAREADAAGPRRGKDAGKIHGARGPVRNRRPFRRKSG